jgi:hypothetical protein
MEAAYGRIRNSTQDCLAAFALLKNAPGDVRRLQHAGRVTGAQPLHNAVSQEARSWLGTPGIGIGI